jgi:Fe-S cluster assembly ATPase SufC
MMLAVQNLEVRYGGITALRGVSIEVAEGETVLLVGANGAGKSSLINAVIGLAGASRGTVRFAGHDISGLACDGRARAGMRARQCRTTRSLGLALQPLSDPAGSREPAGGSVVGRSTADRGSGSGHELFPQAAAAG